SSSAKSRGKLGSRANAGAVLAVKASAPTTAVGWTASCDFGSSIRLSSGRVSAEGVDDLGFGVSVYGSHCRLFCLARLVPASLSDAATARRGPQRHTL